MQRQDQFEALEARVRKVEFRNLAAARQSMKYGLTIATISILAILIPNSGEAETFNKTVPSGRTTLVKVYRSWNRNCSSGPGVVKVVTKPQHGALTSGSVASTIPKNDISGYNRCLGRPIIGFAVNYTPAAGYHGIDRFTIDVIYHQRSAITDTYTITVR
jgi:hypothetical protein